MSHMTADRLKQLTRLYEADPADTFVCYGIGLEHAKHGRLDEAIEWLDKTLDLDAHYCYAYFHKAKLLSEAGDLATARAVLEAGSRMAQEAGDDHARSEIEELLKSFEE